MDAFAYSPACQALADISARIGGDPLLIQAAGGNTSVKEGDTLWVKASGLWLRDAEKRPLFVPVALADVRSRVAANEADPVGPTLRRDLAPPGLRPSIETTLHALMPHPVVLHVHAVDAIAWAVQPDGEAALRRPLAGQRWAWVPYVRPGLPLTQSVAALMAQGRPLDVLVMANHGLVVGGATVAEAEHRLHAVISVLCRPVRAAPPADRAELARLAEGTRWRLPGNPRIHAIATDPINLRRAQRGVLYPDHVVFLGATLATAPFEPDAADWPPCLAVPGAGMLVRDDLSEAAAEMLTCLADVLVRLPAEPEPVWLPREEAEGLANWEAEKFRKQQVR